MVKAILEAETLGYPFWVGGMVKNFHLSDFGHIYFNLYDEDYSIRCMLPESVRGTLDFSISNGLEIEILGSVGVYDKRASIQIEVEKARLIDRTDYKPDPSTIERLQAQNLWPHTQKALPETVRRIGLITSKQSEALQDFENTFRDENGQASVDVVDVRLQGQQAPGQIANAISRLNHHGEVDVIVLTRGGGRADDLAVFNEYQIAEAICRSVIPVVTGIGHQRDDTFADQVADYSAYTPTAAAVHLARLSHGSERSQPQQEAQKTTRSNQLVVSLFTIIAVLLMILIVLVISNQA